MTAPEIRPRSARDVDQDVTLGPGFALELPIFDQNQARNARARYLLEQAVHRLNALETTIVREAPVANRATFYAGFPANSRAWPSCLPGC